MIDFALDQKTNDLIFEEFDFQLFDGLEQVGQNLGIRLRFFLGEWFLDITQGVAYYQEVFLKAPNLIQVESIIKQEIVDTRGVEELITYESDFNSRTRTYFVKFQARATGGETLLQELELPV